MEETSESRRNRTVDQLGWKNSDFLYSGNFPLYPGARPLSRDELADKLISKSDVVGECWVWNGATDKDGYGWAYAGRTSKSGHRFNEKANRLSLAFKLGRDLHEGMLSCHTCHNPACINPEHLYEGSAVDNERDKIESRRHNNQLKTHCPKGHEYSESNTYLRPDAPEGKVWRDCIACRNERKGR